MDARSHRHRCLFCPGGHRPGRACSVLLPSAAGCARVRSLRTVGRGALRRRKCEPRCARGSRQPLGPRSFWSTWAAGRLSAGLHGPHRLLDHRRRYDPMARCRSLRCRWCAAAMAGLCARQPLQRVGRDPARAHVGNQRRLRSDPPSQLPGVVRQLAGMGLAFRSGVGVLLSVLTMPPLLARIHAEERLLRSQFGDEYVEYCARTSRLVPGIY
jgi:hypothetical protein